MQGLAYFIPTQAKVTYINALLKVGFDTIDFGSFVSAKVIPQMRDTAEVLAQLDDSPTRLLAIVASVNGARTASDFERVHYLGFPLSVSETFQRRNTHKGIKQSLECVQEIQEMCVAKGKTLVIYISMGFGNPYGDPYSPAVVEDFAGTMAGLGVRILSLSDTIGISTPDTINHLYRKLIPALPDVEFGAHFHSNPATATQKIVAAWDAGCRRFDGAIGGYGGCPMAKEELTGNIATETLLRFADERGIATGIDKQAFGDAMLVGNRVFVPSYINN
jgi:hydroxymethylglutaryl-CoA lyase